jgi:integrase
MFYVYERVPAAIIEAAKGRTVTVSFDLIQIQVKLGLSARFSLRTTDMKAAKERFRQATACLQEHYGLIRQELATGPVRLTHKQIEALAGEFHREETDQHQDDPGDPDGWDAALSILHDAVDDQRELETLHGKAADLLLHRRGLAIDETSRLHLLEAMHRAYIQFAEAQERRGRGDYSPSTKANQFPEYTEGERPRGTDAAKLVVSLSHLFDLWAKEHQKTEGPERTVKDFRQKVESLRTFVGHDEATAITQRQIIDWCDQLQDVNRLSPKTVADKYLTAVRAVFRVGQEKGRLDTSPAAGVRVRKPKPVKTRPKGFTDEEAKAILTAALCAPSTLGRMAAKNKLAIRWVPWIGAYTGARVTELTQLRKVDFAPVDGIACLRITPEAGSVKSRAYRVVPIHPHLVEMGLLDFVAQQEEGHLFATPSDTPAKTLTRCESVGKKIGEWVRSGVGITDDRVQPTHAWRHRFKTLATVVDIAPEYADMIQGHSRGDAASAYREPDMRALFREIQKLPRYEWPKRLDDAAVLITDI